MKPTHYISKELSILKHTGRAACGIYVSREKYGDNVTRNREDVTCLHCTNTKIFRQVKDQQTCKHGKIVGCDYTGRKHKCNCVAGAFIEVPDDRK